MECWREIQIQDFYTQLYTGCGSLLTHDIPMLSNRGCIGIVSDLKEPSQ